MEKLKEPDFFKKVHVQPDFNTVTWLGEIDFDPDRLYVEGVEVQDLFKLVKIIKDYIMLA